MAYSEDFAEIMRSDLGVEPGLSERRMFGGLCFMLHGNMICGVMKEHAMYRVGKPREAEAIAAGAQEFAATGRKMGGMVQLDFAGFEDDATRRALTALALANANSLPPKKSAR